MCLVLLLLLALGLAGLGFFEGCWALGGEGVFCCYSLLFALACYFSPLMDCIPFIPFQAGRRTLSGYAWSSRADCSRYAWGVGRYGILSFLVLSGRR